MSLVVRKGGGFAFGLARTLCSGVFCFFTKCFDLQIYEQQTACKILLKSGARVYTTEQLLCITKWGGCNYIQRGTIITKLGSANVFLGNY